MLRYNLQTGFWKCWYRVLLVWGYVCIGCIEFNLRCRIVYQSIGIPDHSWGDYLMYVIGGVAEFHPGINRIEIPVNISTGSSSRSTRSASVAL